MTSEHKLNIQNSIYGILFTLLAAPLLYFATVKEMGIYILPAVAGLLVFYFVFKKPEVWIYTSLGLFVLFTSSRGEESSGDDYFFAFYYILGILFWLAYQVFVKREKIVRNYGDIFILLFSLGVITNFFAAYNNDISTLKWLRESSMMYLYLFYFPIRHYFPSEKKAKPLMVFFALALVAISLIHISHYYYALNDMQYAYQLASADKINQTIFTVSIVFGLVFSLYQTKRRNELLLIFFVGIVAVALILTFSRTFWMILIMMSLLLFIFIPMRKKISMLKMWGLLLALAMSVFLIILGDKVQLISTLLEKRISSVGSGTKDESMRSRYNEWNYALREFERYPMSGNGYGAKVNFFNILTGTTYRTLTIHNGYIYMLFRAGLPMTLFFLSFFLYYTLKAFFLSISRAEPFYKALSISCFLGYLSVWIANTTSAQFVYRDGFFTIFLLVALTSIAEQNIKQNKKLEA